MKSLGVDFARLARLQRETNEILAAAPNTIGGPVNWASLHCYSARAWTDDEGQTGVTVEIEEASPDAIELHGYVSSELEKRGWPHVEVRTEW